MADDQERDLQRFLENVDEITNLIQEMNSDDPFIQQKAVLDTEKKLLLMEREQEEDGCRTTLNKTMISPPQAPENANEMNPDAFLASVEKDAKERAKRRRENRVLADALKEKGNEAFVKGDYETAIFFYSEGLGKLKDMKVLYTNRAQAYIKLGDYQKALVDCDWALKCDENCTKAYFHMGKAHLALKNYSKSKECYQKIGEINPKLKAQVKGTERTLFRTYGGFSIINDHEVIKRCLFLAGKDAVEEIVCVSVLKLWQEVCIDNEENQRLLLSHPDMAKLLPSFMDSRILVIQQQSLALLLQLTQTDNGRNQVIKHLDMTRLCEALLSFLDFSDKKANTAIGLFTDLALEERFQVWFHANLPDVLPALTGALKREPKLTSPSALCQCIALMGNISAEPTARRHMLAYEEFGDACLDLLVKCEEDMDLYREVTYTLLGLIMNLCLEVPFLSESWAMKISRKCLSLLNSQDGGILTRAAGVLSRTLSSSQTIVEEALTAGVVKKMIKFLKTGGPTASRYAMKTLAVCTNSYHAAREEVMRLDKKFNVLMTLLASEDEVVVGNAALCLGNCMEVPSAASSLLKTDIMRVLLKLAGGDSQETAVQLNAGIALGKLCTAEPRFAVQLQELHGIQILNSTMKHLNDS
uniref:Tetratricopeptide repeat domain 12 n=1 Tax=Rattus norvegicus TaxID=10116 RepID=F7FHS8_RAT